MALPFTRDVTISSGTQIPSTLLNNLQDMVVGGKHGEIRRLTSGVDGIWDGQPDVDVGMSVGFLRWTGNGTWTIPLEVHFGERLKDLFVTSKPGTIGDNFDSCVLSSSDQSIFTTAFSTDATGTAQIREEDPLAGETPPIVPDLTIGPLVYAMQITGGVTTTVDLVFLDYLVDMP